MSFPLQIPSRYFFADIFLGRGKDREIGLISVLTLETCYNESRVEWASQHGTAWFTFVSPLSLKLNSDGKSPFSQNKGGKAIKWMYSTEYVPSILWYSIQQILITFSRLIGS